MKPSAANRSQVFLIWSLRPQYSWMTTTASAFGTSLGIASAASTEEPLRDVNETLAVMLPYTARHERYQGRTRPSIRGRARSRGGRGQCLGRLRPAAPAP